MIRVEGRVRPWIQQAEVKARASRMLRAMGLEQKELSLVLCDDPTIHALNRDYRHKDKPTDVLAFAMNEGEEGTAFFEGLHSHVLGDVVISLETAARQAKEHARAPEDELTMLLAHGLLHLLGLDHRDRTEERRMKACTDLLRAAAVTVRRSPRSGKKAQRGG
jgi:probable rRNA maturation factor